MFATLKEALGVDSFDTPEMQLGGDTTSFTLADKIFGTDVHDEGADPMDAPAGIRQNKKITQTQVKRYISNVYKTKGIAGVWSVLDPRVKQHVLKMCTKQMVDFTSWFDDLFKSPEKMLILLAMVFVLIVVLDTSAPAAETNAPPMYYYQYPRMPGNPVDLSPPGMT